MEQSKSSYKRYARVGPGGWKCSCCGPAPGKEKKHAIRRWKKTERVAHIRQILKEEQDL